MTPASFQEQLDQLLELVFWAGQHNQYPDQNLEPETSVAETSTAITRLIIESLPEKRLTYPGITDDITNGFNNCIDTITAVIEGKQTV